MSIQTLSVKNTVVQRTGHLVSYMNGNLVMLSIEQGKYYNLGEIGGDIWHIIITPTKIDSLINQLLGRYEVEKEICQEQVLAFITELFKENLIMVSK
jgi:hypothetical protein